MKKIAHLLAALLLCSCTIVNSGSYLDSIGRECPEVQARQNKKAISTWQVWESVYETWHMGDYYYIKLPVVYAPRNEPLLISFHIMPWMERGQWIFPTSPTAGGLNRHAYLTTLPSEVYYAELTADQRKDCGAAYKFAPDDRPLYRPYRLLRANEIDLSKATKVEDTYIFNPDSLVRSHLNDRRSTGNQIRRPLSWLLCVADIPLSLGASAAGVTCELLALPVLILEDLSDGD